MRTARVWIGSPAATPRTIRPAGSDTRGGTDSGRSPARSGRHGEQSAGDEVFDHAWGDSEGWVRDQSQLTSRPNFLHYFLRTPLEAAYKKAITDYTKKMDAEAGAIKDELAAFLEESDKLLEKATAAREGSRWEGSLREEVLRDDQVIKQSSSTILVIKKRKGAEFHG